ncbi:MAG: type III-A CRISPR-associated protein Csm2 [Bryobacteraceae bacterium]|nr:type III-A CRISPR-associated protein Csm2 [Bryobacteraceae bacterium]
MSDQENEVQQPREPEPAGVETVAPAAAPAPVEEKPPAPAPEPEPAAPAAEPEPAPAEAKPEAPAGEAKPPEPKPEPKQKGEGRPAGPRREPREPKEPREPRELRERGPKPQREGGREQNRGEAGKGGDRGDRRGPRPGGRDMKGGRPELAFDIDLEKLIADSLYLDNQAHAVVSRMRDMDSGTRSQLRRLYSAIRRACRATEGDRQHQFVMLRARLAYTIARHQLRSLDGLEKLLLQVTRKNDARGYERFRDLFEAIVAYNE